MKHEFTDEQFRAVEAEVADLVPSEQFIEATYQLLILQARAEREEARKWLGIMEASTNGHWKDLCQATGERDAALARVRELEATEEKDVGNITQLAEMADKHAARIAALEAENAELRKTIAGYDTQCRNLWDRNAEICHSLGWDPEQPPLKRIAENERLRVKVDELLEYFSLHDFDETPFREYAEDLHAALKGEEK